ncbi:MAG: 16S rRNA (adenine(1518)-N(6)/adenine(1519)-N(6))-dimethyltransferase RsmA [Crocinitomicaceae bacterium]|jgi:16S rRNA (adenine1518-N6/adenine1519-N6)-dimethyltransferase|nr:16S rRNA (adenine(1518)-N(6)/adenine(1519)-N(6))-dimethyltransferase RsmA [Crocinitomicaceae bacterium]MDA9169309.1 16S rRNA (adenine(1518)-N(6)/adenine(1519)-N(6))-dimethyltransferase RsmA [Crocinitomicaceae bacterium]MDG1036087.1 16S rRNA (adenine(1518)-N(6)/adenine(1519)-N(6))-dimethyltransferase RsmA [Crocinitomicaceae bacterium]MDG1742669.1 16S rRNA (adenine(1518)-N(6)/adenine(1519)-N(6))-dimethyltransferase RsmA [Crocinitomicaceae bacterium]
MSVKAKKHLGQHFLTDKNICQKIANQYQKSRGCKKVLEIGPGMGALTEFLLKNDLDVWAMDVDTESIDYLKKNFPALEGKLLEADFLKADLNALLGDEPFSVVGNFPYNISSQILFKCIDFRNQIPEIMGMFQREVAQRVAEPPGSKQYGILSVLLQTYYDIDYCFTVDEHVFNPPPKVKSGVIRCVRNDRDKLPCDEKLFKQLVKMSFNQRRKTIRNSIKPLIKGKGLDHEFLALRPEVLSVDQFIELTQLVASVI